MKFSIANALMGLSTLSMVMASPFPAVAISPRGDGLTAPAMSSHLTRRDADTSPRGLDDVKPWTEILARQQNDIFSKFKIHVVTASARVIGIIIIDYAIHKLTLPGADESITANYDKLTNVEVNGEIVATHFDNPPTLLGQPQQAVFDFSTAVVSGVLDLGLNAAGVVTSVVRSSAVHLGTNVVAKALHIFNENNVRVGTVNL